MAFVTVSTPQKGKGSHLLSPPRPVRRNKTHGAQKCVPKPDLGGETVSSRREGFWPALREATSGFADRALVLCVAAAGDRHRLSPAPLSTEDRPGHHGPGGHSLGG